MVALLIYLLFTQETMLIDFGQSKENSWSSVNDSVMGGRSTGNTNYSDDVLSFTGSISFQNNGGFASVRSPYTEMDLSDYSEVTIRYRCEGQSLNFGLQYYREWYKPNYKIILPATDMKWKTVSLRMDEFKEYRIGRPTGSLIPKEVLNRILRFSIMTNDKKEGPFQAEIDYIRFE